MNCEAMLHLGEKHDARRPILRQPSGLAPPDKMEGPSRLAAEDYFEALWFSPPQQSFFCQTRDGTQMQLWSPSVTGWLKSCSSRETTPALEPAHGPNRLPPGLNLRQTNAIRIEKTFRELGEALQPSKLLELGIHPQSLMKLIYFGAQALPEVEFTALLCVERFVSEILADVNDKCRFFALIAKPYATAALRQVIPNNSQLLPLGYKPARVVQFIEKYLDRCATMAAPPSAPQLHVWFEAAWLLEMQPAMFFDIYDLDANMLDALALNRMRLSQIRERSDLQARLSTKTGDAYDSSAHFLGKLVMLGDASKINRFALCAEALMSLGMRQSMIFELIYADDSGAFTDFVLDYQGYFKDNPDIAASYVRIVCCDNASRRDASVKSAQPSTKRQKMGDIRSADLIALAQQSGLRRAQTDRDSKVGDDAALERIASLSTAAQLRLRMPVEWVFSTAQSNHPQPVTLAKIRRELAALLTCGMSLETLCRLSEFEGAEHVIDALEDYVYHARIAQFSLGTSLETTAKSSISYVEPQTILDALMPLFYFTPIEAGNFAFVRHPENIRVLLMFIAMSNQRDEDFARLFETNSFLAIPPKRIAQIVNTFEDVQNELGRDDQIFRISAKTLCAYAAAKWQSHTQQSLSVFRSYFYPLCEVGLSSNLAQEFMETKKDGLTKEFDFLALMLKTTLFDRDGRQPTTPQLLSGYALWLEYGSALPASLRSVSNFAEVVELFAPSVLSIYRLSRADDPAAAFKWLEEYHEELLDDVETPIEDLIASACTDHGRQALAALYLS